MQSLPVRAALLLVLPLGGATVKTNPLGTVVELLEDLSRKITKEGEAEQKAFKEFTDWCDNAARNKRFEITTATSRKASLDAGIQKAAGDAEASAAKIEDLAGSIATDEKDLRSATLIREKEAADFQASDTELVDVVGTLGRAITVLEREMAKNPASFAQLSNSGNLQTVIQSLTTVVDAASLSSADKTRLMALVQSDQGAQSGDDDFGAPAATVYKTHSTNIMDVLEDLKEKAEEQLASLRKAELNAKHNYDMLKQSLEDQGAADQKSLAEEKSAKAATEEHKATAEGDLAGTVKDLADAQSGLKLASQNCMQTAADHEATVKARKEELDVIAKAKELLTSSSAGAVQQTYSFVQLSKSEGSSSLRTRADLANAEIVTLVKKLAKEHHSAALSQLASRISAIMRFGAASGEDPFAKVKGLISDLIAKLESEASGEATEKAYCDEQLSKTKEKKGELQHDISKLSAKIDQAAAKSAGLKADVREAQADLAFLAKTQAEMDQTRREGHAAFVQAQSDLETGLEGVRKAISVLREYYGAGGAAFVQRNKDALPAVPEVHAAATDAGTSIIGILEVVESDFSKGLAADQTEEDSSEAEYQQMTQENKVTTTLKNQDVKYQSAESKALDKSMAELSGDRDTTDAELSAVLEYFGKIQDRCIAKPEAYEDRKRRRTAEIAGLKEALSILRDEVAFVQSSKRGLLRSSFLAH